MQYLACCRYLKRFREFSNNYPLFQLCYIENEIVSPEKRSNFIEILEEEMVKNPKYWIKYYFGNDLEKQIDRKYSLSDRSRYYMALPRVEEAIDKLFENLKDVNIPMGMLKQYMPIYIQKTKKY